MRIEVASACGLLLFDALALGQQSSPTPRPAAVQVDTSQIPKDYEMLEESASPNGRFACSPRCGEGKERRRGWSAVSAKSFRAAESLCRPGGSENTRPASWLAISFLAEWNGNDVVAVWVYAKWGIANLSVYEIANDKLKRTHPVFREAWEYFDRYFRQRFLKKYPKEYDQYTFVSHENETDFAFKGRTLLLNLYAENKPSLAPVRFGRQNFMPFGIWTRGNREVIFCLVKSGTARRRTDFAVGSLGRPGRWADRDGLPSDSSFYSQLRPRRRDLAIALPRAGATPNYLIRSLPALSPSPLGL